MFEPRYWRKGAESIFTLYGKLSFNNATSVSDTHSTNQTITEFPLTIL